MKIFIFLLFLSFSMNSFTQTSVFDLTLGPEGGSINDVLRVNVLDYEIYVIATDNGVYYGRYESSDAIDMKISLVSLAGIKVNKIDTFNFFPADPYSHASDLYATEKGLFYTDVITGDTKRLPTLYDVDPVTGEKIYPNVTDVEVIGDTINVIANGIHLFSPNGGETWLNGQSASNPHEITKVTLEDTVLTLSHTIPFSAKASVSFDGGATWESMDDGLPDYPDKLASTSTNTYALSDNKLFRADFNALEWFLQIDTVGISGFHADNDNLLVWDSAWVFLYNDKDGSRLKLPDFEYPDIISFGGAYKVEQPLFEVIVGTESSGLFNYFEDETDTWQRQIDGLSAADVTTMFINPDNFNLFAGTSNGEIHESPDEGITWEIKGKLPGVPLDMVRTDEGTLIACSGEINFGDIYRSTNEGVSWDLVQEGDFQHFAVTDSNHLLATDYDTGIHISRDDGQTWNVFIRGFSGNDAIYDIHTAQNGNIFISTYDRLAFSENGGYNWTLLGDIQSNDLASLNDSNLFLASNGGIFQYNINTGSVENILPEQAGNAATQIISINDSILVAGFQNGAVYRSADIANKSTALDVNWEMLNPPGLNKQINGIAGFVENDSLKIFMAPEGSAVWRSWPMPETSTHAEKISKTKNVRLKIYPNPAKNRITLEFNNSHPDEIIVTDLSGRRLIHSTNLEHKPVLNIRHLQTGIYIIQAIRENKIIGAGKFVKSQQ